MAKKEKTTEETKEILEVVPEKKEIKIFSVSDLKNSGAFVDRKPVLREVSWTNPETDEEFNFNVFVRRQSYKTFSVFIDKADYVKDKDKTCLMVSRCLAKDETGEKDLLTYEEVSDLDFNLVIAFVNAIYEVNNKKK